MNAIKHCEVRAKSKPFVGVARYLLAKTQLWLKISQFVAGDDSCMPLRHYLETVGYVPHLSCAHHCVVFDERKLMGENSEEDVESAKQFCGVSVRHCFVLENFM